jgi:uncharacterized repeat protein (TIGR01451 family)
MRKAHRACSYISAVIERLKLTGGRARVAAFVILAVALAGVAVSTISYAKSSKRRAHSSSARHAASGKRRDRNSSKSASREGAEAEEQARPEGQGERYEQLLEMENFWAERLSYPTGQFDPAWVREAARQDSLVERAIPAGRVNTSLGMSPLALSPGGFTSLGPAPEHMTGCNGCFDYGTTEGRVNSIAVDPTTTNSGSIVAYIATVGGGVWKTTNCCSSTTTWTTTTDDPLVSTTSVDSVTIDPNNHNTVYAGTGDLNYGSFSMGSQGILKSTDGGATWTVLGANVFGAALPEPAGQFPQYNAVGKVRVDPNNSNNVVAGTKTGLYFSYDGGANWTGPCLTNSFNTQRQDITGLELTNIGGTTRILAAVGTRGFATPVQYNLDQNGANGLYKGTMPLSGCPSDFTSITSNANGFVYGTSVTGSPYATGNLLNAGTGTPYGGSTSSGNQLGRMDIAVAPSNPNVIYAQVGSIAANNNSGCGNTSGCQLGVWSSTDGGATWSFLSGSQGGSLRNCAGGNTSSNPGDYPQNWYDQGIAVDPNNPDRVFIDTYDTWLVSRTGTSFYDVTCGYNGSALSAHVVHVDHHALAFVPGSSSILLEGSDGGIFSTSNADQAISGVTRPTWVNMDNGITSIEFYSGDISGNFATSPTPQAVGGAQDNGPSSVTFSGSPTGPVQWQMGLGGDGFSGLINPTGQGPTAAQGTITVSAAGTAGQTFTIGSQTFTWAATRGGTGQVAVGTTASTAATNIRTAVNADISSTAYASGSGTSVVVNATAQGAGGNSITFANGNSANLTFNGTGTLGGTTQGGNPGSAQPVFFEGNNSGGFSRCITNCTNSGAAWSSVQGGWTADTQSFVLPVHIFRGGIPGGDDCPNGCGHLLAGTTRVFETITANANSAGSGVFWYVTNNPTTQNLTKQTLGNRSYINQVKYSPKFQSVAIVGTNDGNVQIGFNLGTGAAAQANWVNVTDGNNVLPNRPVLGVALDPSASAANLPAGYAALGGFDQNTPTTTGHVYKVTCAAGCATFNWENKSGNLPNIPVDSIIVNPNFPQQVFAGTDFGLYYTDDIRVASPTWYRFNAGLPNAMIWDMAIDRGNTTLSLWTRGRGAFAWPLPLGPVQPLATVNAADTANGTYGGTTTLSATLTEGGFPLAGKSVSFTLNGNGVGSGTTNSSGVATVSNVSLSGINAGSYPNAVGASFAGDSGYQSSSSTNSLTVAKASTSVTWSNPADIIYGTALDSTQLDASGSVPGSFVYTPAAGTVLSSGNNQTLHADFTPTDTSNYDGSSKDVSINVLTAVLNLSMTADRNPAPVGLNFNYKPVISNTGNAAATNVTLTDTLPSLVTFTSVSPSQGTCSYNSLTRAVTCSLGTIGTGSSANVQITVKPRDEGTLNDTASIAAGQWDAATGNSGASVNGLPAVKQTDLSASMSNSADPIFAGQQTSYTVVVKNNSTVVGASGVVLTDTLPASMTFVSATTSQGSLVTPPVGSTGTVTANLGSLGIGATATVTVTVTGTSPGVQTNTATVSGNEQDPTPANNTASQATTVKAAALQKVLLASQVLTGGCQNTTGQVYLTGPAGPGGMTVQLSTSSLAGVSVPASVFIPAGQTVSPAFSVTTSPVATKQVGLVVAGSGNASVSRGLTVNVGSGVCGP